MEVVVALLIFAVFIYGAKKFLPAILEIFGQRSDAFDYTKIIHFTKRDGEWMVCIPNTAPEFSNEIGSEFEVEVNKKSGDITHMLVCTIDKTRNFAMCGIITEME